MTPESLRKNPSVLAQCLPISPVIVALHRAEEPAKLFERNDKLTVILLQHAPESLRGEGVRSARVCAGAFPALRQMSEDLALDFAHPRLQLGKGVLFEQYQILTDRVQPIDDRIETGRRGPNVHRPPVQHRACGAMRGLSRCAGTLRGTVTGGEHPPWALRVRSDHGTREPWGDQ